MVTISVRDSQGYISGLTPEIQEAIDEATSFRPSGFQFTRAYQLGRTDGRVRLLKHSKFPAGLVGRIIDTLKDKGVPYELEVENANVVKPNLHVECIGIQSRPYQDNAVENALLNPRGIIRAPTGSGKTAIGTRIIQGRGKYALVVVPTIDLLWQYKSFLQQHLLGVADDGKAKGPIKIGQLGDGVVDPQPITVATVRTAAKAVGADYVKYEFAEYDDKEKETSVSPSQMREWVNGIGTLIVDEAHILGAKTVYDVTNKVPAPNKYGMSASPWRDDGADLMIEAATGKPIYRINTKELVDDGYLVAPIIQVMDTKGWWTPASWGQTCQRCGTTRRMTAKGPAKTCDCGSSQWRSEFQDAYREEIVENVVRNAKIAEIVNACQEPTLVLVKQIKHGNLLKPMIPGCVFLSGSDSGEKRDEVYQQIRDGELNVVIASTIADLGLDVPALTHLVLAGGGKSSTRHLQRIGRVARPYPGKTFARVVDFDDSHVHKWFRSHAKARRKIEVAEWRDSAIWI